MEPCIAIFTKKWAYNHICAILYGQIPIVPVFQVEDYLDQCLNSIENQSIENIEIICSYTTSTDKSLAILKEHTKKDNRVKIVYRDDGGLGGARNYGLKFAKGEYVLFVDSDDWLESNMCEVLWNLAIKNRLSSKRSSFFLIKPIWYSLFHAVTGAFSQTISFSDKRFFYVYGMRRKYLDAVRKCINKTDYVEFIKIITKKSKAAIKKIYSP